MADLERQLGLALAKVRELRAENEELKRALNQHGHVVEFREDDYALEHPVECRTAGARLLDCKVNAALHELPGSPIGYGRFPVTLDEDGELVFDISDDDDIAPFGTVVN